jgi:hypothetical protein
LGRTRRSIEGSLPRGFQNCGPKRGSPNWGSPKVFLKEVSRRVVTERGSPKDCPPKGITHGCPTRGFPKGVFHKGVPPRGSEKECPTRLAPQAWSPRGVTVGDPQAGSLKGGPNCVLQSGGPPMMFDNGYNEGRHQNWSKGRSSKWFPSRGAPRCPQGDPSREPH